MTKLTKFHYLFKYFCSLRFYRRSAKFNLSLSRELEEIIHGLILGDLFVERIKLTSNSRLQFKQSNKNKEYIDHLYLIFKDYCGTGPKLLTSFDSRPEKNKFYFSVKFNTLSLPCFNKFREIYYNSEGVKIIPDNLDSLLTARSLAYWVMDDGYKSGNGFYLCTESFNLCENHKLINILKTKFNLDCGVHKVTNGYRLYIFSSSRKKLLELIKPFLINHFYYKFDLK